MCLASMLTGLWLKSRQWTIRHTVWIQCQHINEVDSLRTMQASQVRVGAEVAEVKFDFLYAIFRASAAVIIFPVRTAFLISDSRSGVLTLFITDSTSVHIWSDDSVGETFGDCRDKKSRFSLVTYKELKGFFIYSLLTTEFSNNYTIPFLLVCFSMWSY